MYLQCTKLCVYIIFSDVSKDKRTKLVHTSANCAYISTIVHSLWFEANGFLNSYEGHCLHAPITSYTWSEGCDHDVGVITWRRTRFWRFRGPQGRLRRFLSLWRHLPLVRRACATLERPLLTDADNPESSSSTRSGSQFAWDRREWRIKILYDCTSPLSNMYTAFRSKCHQKKLYYQNYSY